MGKMRYRLALDLGSTSLGWAMLRLNERDEPCAVIKAGVRIFSDGRNPKDGSSLAVTRRNARAMRRRRDRLLKRKARMKQALIELGFFPADEAQRKALETLNPYTLRAKGLDQALTPAEFARALFHINQRRGFKSNRRTDSKEKDSGHLKKAVGELRKALEAENLRSVGELLERRRIAGLGQRARPKLNIRTGAVLGYDLYIDRAMIEQEFDALWAKQAELNPAQFTQTAGARLKDVLLFQRKLRPVTPGRCTLLPSLPRAPLALPSSQRARIYQELNHLRILNASLGEQALTLAQRDTLAAALDRHAKRSFTQIKKLLGLSGAVQFNFEDPKRQELKGNTTNAILGDAKHFGPAWFDFNEAKQDVIVQRLVTEESEAALIDWLQAETGIDESLAERIANAGLPEGYGSLSAEALARLLPALRAEVITYDKAVIAAGFEHHSQLSPSATGEILPTLPYYGEALQRHVGFGTGAPEDPPERRFGRIPNPTVHIGLNQVRTVVNALIERYGHPSEVIVELARDLKQSREQREEENKRQAERQTRNRKYRSEIAAHLSISEERVKADDLQKVQLWEELNLKNAADRCCPYSGAQIGFAMLFNGEAEIEHILPFSMTLDDSLANKTVALRQANRIKGNRTPWQAFGEHPQPGFDYAAMLLRAEAMPKNKRYRFAADGYQQWLRDDAGFLARALNDTRYLSRVAREYLSLICPQGTRVIPGQMTAKLRGKFGLNDMLGLRGEKNRNDHRHHAVDACVIGVTDQGLLQRFAQASASARERALDRLVDDMPLPWASYREHVARAVARIWVSHRPDHGFEGSMFKETAHGIRPDGSVVQRTRADGEAGRTVEYVAPVRAPQQLARHGLDDKGQPRAYKGYVPDGNHGIEIVRSESGRWQGEVTATFEAYRVARERGVDALSHPTQSLSGRPLVMRLMIDDFIKLEIDGRLRVMRIASINAAGRLSLADHQEANVDARNRDREGDWRYTYKQAGSLQAAKARRVTISPDGRLNDPGFAG